MNNAAAITLIIFALIYSNNSHANPDRVAYELQHECRKSAEEYFSKEIGAGINETDDRIFITTSENHYNSRLNKCFILIKSKAIYKAPAEKSNSYEDILLQELSENSLYGHYRGYTHSKKSSFCNIRDWKCESKEQFEKKVKFLMND